MNTPQSNSIQFDQPIGHSVGGFTVGHQATMSSSKAQGTITGLKHENGQLIVSLFFAQPQPVDAPQGALCHYFHLNWRNITSTWRPAAAA
ncbi:hypothetical protein [Noviherbaspirillum pedocola]|uniref:Uncharacterized protein n=1 Tax=Noviherbaspirillum pedocola TaxID=2801341 RepID=A0A934SUK7_9BURK|nr:hypothetical protein [Noviherbaspirillum pedocola]MBK4735997.1 hypothetical protein [Noviherbaspirillum pedocola]